MALCKDCQAKRNSNKKPNMQQKQQNQQQKHINTNQDGRGCARQTQTNLWGRGNPNNKFRGRPTVKKNGEFVDLLSVAGRADSSVQLPLGWPRRCLPRGLRGDLGVFGFVGKLANAVLDLAARLLRAPSRNRVLLRSSTLPECWLSAPAALRAGLTTAQGRQDRAGVWHGRSACWLTSEACRLPPVDEPCRRPTPWARTEWPWLAELRGAPP